MQALAVVLSLAVATTVCAQNVTRSFGSVVFPGGATSKSAGISRNFGSVVFPGGTTSQPVRGGSMVIGAPVPPVQGMAGRGQNFRRPQSGGRGARSASPIVFWYPVYVGGYPNGYPGGDPSGDGSGYAGGDASGYAPEEPPPPQQQQAWPVMIQAGPDGNYTTMMPQRPNNRPARREVVEEPEPNDDVTRYLIAFKDHTIYSAVAYWADGDTLHYFTSGNTHNQASMSLIDRPLTDRLNKELGIDFKLPAAK